MRTTLAAALALAAAGCGGTVIKISQSYFLQPGESRSHIVTSDRPQKVHVAVTADQPVSVFTLPEKDYTPQVEQKALEHVAPPGALKSAVKVKEAAFDVDVPVGEFRVFVMPAA